MASPIPSTIKLHKQTQQLELGYRDGNSYLLSAEFLRVLSPSAEVRGHGTPTLQTGKKNVAILKIEPVGNYAIKITFDDEHDTGLYSWDYLFELSTHQTTHWDNYLHSLHAAGKSREPDVSVVRLVEPKRLH
jgi:DUF971 family protein